jgi:tRNA-dihydrouridine synthase 4
MPWRIPFLSFSFVFVLLYVYAKNSTKPPAEDFTFSPTAPPTITQFGASSPFELARATTLAAPFVNGVDLNCGCPQSWACADNLGAALMQKPELVVSMVKAAKQALCDAGYADKKTVSVKIRIHKDLRRTVDFVRSVEEAGADFVTVHGRQRATRSSQPVDLKAIKLLKEHSTVPMIANGDVFSFSDAFATAQETGVDGVLAARGLLQNPALFQGYENCPWEAVEVFMSKVVKRPIPFKLVVHHLTEMCGSDRVGGVTGGGAGTLLNKEERMKLVACESMVELVDFLDSICTLRRLE